MRVTSSLIVCTRNRLADIIRLIPSVAQQIESPQEFIIVDSSPVPLNSYTEFKDIFNQNNFPQTQLIYQHTQIPGTSHQRNEGARLATSDLLHFVDDDSIVESTYVQQMNATFIKYPQCAGGMGTVMNMPLYRYTIDRLLRQLFLLQRDYASGNVTLSGMPTHAYGTKKFKFVEVLGGCCMSYRREIFLRYLFDETLGQYAYLEDVDLAYRVSRSHALFYNPLARMQHIRSPINRAHVERNRHMFICNYSKLFFKNIYPEQRWKTVFYCWSVLGLFVCAIKARSYAQLRGYGYGLYDYFFKS